MATNQKSILEFWVQAFTLHSYTRYESTLLIRIHKYCQKDISNAITQQKEERHLCFTFEENAEQMRHTRIPLRALEPNRSHYPRTKSALESMAGKSVQIPGFLPSGAMTYAIFPQLFKVSFMRKCNRDYVVLHTSLDVLKCYLSNKKGYYRLNLDTYFSFKRFATRQAYRFYYAHLCGYSKKLTPQFIAATFSVKDEGTYKDYASVKKNLLEPARVEMEKAFNNGTSEVYFRYKPLYENETKDGLWCKHVLFTFITREDENPTGDKLLELQAYQTRIKMTLEYVWGVDTKVAIELAKRIRYTMMPEMDAFFNHQDWFAKEMERKHTPIRNRGGFMRWKLNSFLKEREGI